MTYYIEQGKLKHTKLGLISSEQYEDHIFKKIFENGNESIFIESKKNNDRYLSIIECAYVKSNENVLNNSILILINISEILDENEKILLTSYYQIRYKELSVCLLLSSNSISIIDLLNVSITNTYRIYSDVNIIDYAISLKYSHNYEIRIHYNNYLREYNKNKSTNEFEFIEERDSIAYSYPILPDILDQSIKNVICEYGSAILFIATLDNNETLNIYKFSKSKNTINLINTVNEINNYSKVFMDDRFEPCVYVHKEGKIYSLCLNSEISKQLKYYVDAIDVIFPVHTLSYKPKIVNVKKAINS